MRLMTYPPSEPRRMAQWLEEMKAAGWNEHRARLLQQAAIRRHCDADRRRASHVEETR
ncbi:MAG: hypothetical protein LBR05_03015 [Azoarcus sp.]|jgi:hypothetical protein|nr:hypothetical protein [Azoarcus sp.]